MECKNCLDPTEDEYCPTCKKWIALIIEKEKSLPTTKENWLKDQRRKAIENLKWNLANRKKMAELNRKRRTA